MLLLFILFLPPSRLRSPPSSPSPRHQRPPLPLRRRPRHHLFSLSLFYRPSPSTPSMSPPPVRLPPLPRQRACHRLRSSLWFFPPSARHRCRPQDLALPSQFYSLSLSSTVQPSTPLPSLLQRRPPCLLLFISSFAIAPPPQRCHSKSRLQFTDLPSLQCGSTPTSSSSFSDLGAFLPRPFFFSFGKLDHPCFSSQLHLLSLSAAMASSSFASVASEPPS